MRWLWCVLIGLAVLTGCTQQSFTPAPTHYAIPMPARTVGEAPPQYDRDKDFGAGWDSVRGQCDTRELKIEEQSGAAAVDKDQDGCADDAALLDPYCGLLNPTDFPRGTPGFSCPGRPVQGSSLQADHVLSEHASWVLGAWRWSPEQRRAFSQDRTNLIMTYGPENQSKGDRGPEEWRPPDRAGWCQYARVYRHTAIKYLFVITSVQDFALRDMELTCPRTG